MRCIVTGAAGFVGSHLSEHLLSQGDSVIGIDCLTDYYDVAVKEERVQRLGDWDAFRLCRDDLRSAPLKELLRGVDVVFHLAGQPGVRPSWGKEFTSYVDSNVVATQALLEAVREHPVWKLVYASSSSVYGEAESYPTDETVCPRPVSPYGVTKLAGEHLCALYHAKSHTRAVALRLFTVYGAGQRPDMAFSRLVAAAVRGTPFTLYGNGKQTRDFTFVGDVVQAFHLAASSPWTGVANIGGGSRTSMNEVISIVEELAGPIDVVRLPVQRGDVRHTAADTTVARRELGFAPRTTLAQGLAEMVSAERQIHALAPVR
jgi:nucleoside-diphosphate-sugar epimerase